MSSQLTLKAGIVEEFEFYGEELGGGGDLCLVIMQGMPPMGSLHCQGARGANGVGMIVMVIGVCHEYTQTAHTRKSPPSYETNKYIFTSSEI